MLQQPNILIIHCDQLRSDCLGCYGNREIKTPNIDSLSENGVTYINHHTVCPICTPSRYSFWSSMYIHQHGAWDNTSTFPSGYETFPKILRNNGYQTVAVGKMHMNPTYQDIGFSKMELAEQNGIGRYQDDYHRFLMEQGLIDRFDLHHQSGEFFDEPSTHMRDMCQCAENDLRQEYYSTEWVTNKALEQLEEWGEGDSHLLMVGYISPHHPFDPPAPYSTMYPEEKISLLEGYTEAPLPHDIEANGTSIDYKSLTEQDIKKITAAYYGMITEIDDGIGKLIDTLKKKNVYDNTMIVFTSDHGEYLGYHHMILKCNYLYEPLAKIPLIIKYPHNQMAGNREEALSENIDVSVTILETCGLQKADTMQGIPLHGEKKRQFVVSEGQYGTEGHSCVGYMIKRKDCKLLLKGSFQNAMFYDLEKDPNELVNQIDNPKYQETIQQLKQDLADFILFHATGNVYHDKAAPQIKEQKQLDNQMETIKDFIRKRW